MVKTCRKSFDFDAKDRQGGASRKLNIERYIIVYWSGIGSHITGQEAPQRAPQPLVKYHMCGGKGHFKRECPNKKVLIVNEDNEYETGDDADPESEALDDDGYSSDGVPLMHTRHTTLPLSQKVLNVTSSSENQRCNLFQTKVIVGPNMACKVIVDGGSCRCFASKELCAKLKLKYIVHPNPYYIQWLSDNWEMKVSYMVRVEFQNGPYKNTIECDVVPMIVCHLLLGRPWQYDRNVQHNGRANTYHLNWHGRDITLRPMTPQHIVNESRQKIGVNLEKE